jgi:hypothetical protein
METSIMAFFFSRGSRYQRSAGRPRSFRPRLETLEDRTVLSTLTVLNNLDSGAGSLRAEIAAARSGDTILFAPTLRHQTITLTSGEVAVTKNLNIEGPGANNLAISGNHASRVFDVSPGASLTVTGLSLINGWADGEDGNDSTGGGGGAILNQGGTLNLERDVFSANQAFPHGGAIANYPQSTFRVTDTIFVANQTVGKLGSSWVEGGAIWDSGGTIDLAPGSGVTATISGCTFLCNRAVGGDGGVSTNDLSLASGALGGAIHNDGLSTLTVRNSTFIGNEAVGGNGGRAAPDVGSYFIGFGAGGAITNDEGQLLVVDGCTFIANKALGGSNGDGSTSAGFGYVGPGRGGALSSFGGAATITHSTFLDNEAHGGNGNTGGSGAALVGVGDGGAILNDAFEPPNPLTVSSCTFTNNLALGGVGNRSGLFVGDGMGGAFENFDGAIGVVQGSTFTGNVARGGMGGDALGGAFSNLLGSSLDVGHCTLDYNRAAGGDGEHGGAGGNGLGGGLYNDGSTDFGVSSLYVTGSTITHNRADGGGGGDGGSPGLGIGGGAYLAAGGSACKDMLTVIAHNHASSSDDDVFGVFTPCP